MSTNEAARVGWSASAQGWVANEAILDRAFAPVTAALVQAADLDGARAVLDVGCGSGTLLAEIDGRGVAAVGVDIAAPMVEAARRRVPGAVVEVADAQTADLRTLPGSPFDRVISRFGVMFFAEPVAAFANLRTAVTPGATLAFVCWRTTEENPVFTLGTQVLTPLAGMAAPVSGDRGPTVFADPGTICGVLAASGWSDVAVDPLDVTLRYGGDGRDGVEDRLAVVLSGETARKVREQSGAERWERILQEVRADIGTATTPVAGAVEIPAACWLVTARA